MDCKTFDIYRFKIKIIHTEEKKIQNSFYIIQYLSENHFFSLEENSAVLAQNKLPLS